MDATEMFLARHERLHAHVERLFEGLTEAQIRAPVHPAINPLAWLLWHIARSEDSGVNLLVCGTAQVLDGHWSRRLNAGRMDAGTGMTMVEVLDLSSRLHLPSLMAYWRALGERTRELVAPLRPSALDETVCQERIDDAVERLVVGPAGPRLREHWKGATRGYFLAFLPLAHNCEHIGQADLIRGLLGQPGRL